MYDYYYEIGYEFSLNKHFGYYREREREKLLDNTRLYKETSRRVNVIKNYGDLVRK